MSDKEKESRYYHLTQTLMGLDMQYLLIVFFVLVAIFTSGAALVLWKQHIRDRDKMYALGNELEAKEKENQEFHIAARRADTLSSGAQKTAYPSILEVSESRIVLFPLGSAQISENFKSYLHTTITNVIRQAQSDGLTLVQVVGHTDETRLIGRSNLDDMIISFNRKEASVTQLLAGSNTDLCLMRAMAVVEELRILFPSVQFVAYSAGQSLEVNNTPAQGQESSLKDNPKRRRIEIFLRFGERK